MNLSLLEIAKMCSGELSKNSNPDLILNNIDIDSRKIKNNNTLFVAIHGNVDGHKFVNIVCSNKTNAALVEQRIDLPNLIYVRNTVEALGKLAHNYRLRFQIPVVAITGSNGKTTLKNMLNSICQQAFGIHHVLATDGSLNNHLGVPLTLLRLNAQHNVAIIEMGMNHTGELSYLSRIVRPTIAIVNNVMLAHIGMFKDIQELAKAKGEVFIGLDKGGVMCINKSSPFASMWHNQYQQHKQVYFAMPDTMCFIKSTNSNMVEISTNYGDLKLQLQVLGEHNKINAMTATTLALLLNCNLHHIKDGLEQYTGTPGRLEKLVAFNNAIIINDSYNANPDSVKAAILAIKDLPKPHWFIFGQLGELGKLNQQLHIEIANFANQHHIDTLLAFGPDAKITCDNFNGNKKYFTALNDIVAYCKTHLPATATLLVKGSHSNNLVTVVNQLTRKSK
jgi:UDP-N-acetylmuramoyl-tripeptide--D-alanyl-D-alanine ligase